MEKQAWFLYALSMNKQLKDTVTLLTNKTKYTLFLF